MPTYTFRCLKDKNHVFDELLSINFKENPKCIICNSETEKIIGSSNVYLDFKGKGFYITDYKNNKENEK